MNNFEPQTLNPIKTSVFDLFKIGPGPSSSHTIGPMKAAYNFVEEVRKLDANRLKLADEIEVRLFGSLSATGDGHGTDRAIVAGLLGKRPEEVDPIWFSGLLEKGSSYDIDLGGYSLNFSKKNIIFDDINHDFEYSNTLIFYLKSGEQTLFEKEYYSVGGGFIQWKGYEEPNLTAPPFCYTNMKELKRLLVDENVSLHRLMLENEKALTGATEEEIYDRLGAINDTMCAAVDRGLNSSGQLPGSINLTRKAPIVYNRAKSMPNSPDSFLILLNSYALAASEENAAGNIVVTAPTSGASGVLPGVIYMLRHQFHFRGKRILDAMLAATAIGFLVKHNASISGAEAGCMGEVGTASGMAAALISYGSGYGIDVLEAAAEIALEHHLGMTCDPVGGYVQIPCIERNAVGAVKAYNAYLLASSGDPLNQKVTLDQVIKTMRETGRDMSKKYKETSQGGLALNMTEC
jgi:L-serine dehydratase